MMTIKKAVKNLPSGGAGGGLARLELAGLNTPKVVRTQPVTPPTVPLMQNDVNRLKRRGVTAAIRG